MLWREAYVFKTLIASRYIYGFLIITYLPRYVSTLLCSGRVLCVLFVIQSAPKFD